jgi:hypothetical protein
MKHVSDIDKYSIRRSNSYERHLTSLLKTHYKTDKKSREQFRKLLDDRLFPQLASDPLALGVQESWPANTHQEGWDLRKERYKMPGLRGKSSKGRLIFLVDLENRVSIPLIIYTHKEYPDRPGERELKNMIEGEMS